LRYKNLIFTYLHYLLYIYLAKKSKGQPKHKNEEDLDDLLKELGSN